MGNDGNKALTEGQDDQKMVIISVGESQEVSEILSVPEREVKKGVILAHGAGNDMDQPMLAFFAERSN